MFTKFSSYLRYPSRSRGKEGSVSKKRGTSADRRADNTDERGPRKENAGNGRAVLLANGVDDNRPPLKEVGTKTTERAATSSASQLEERRAAEKEFIRQNDSSAAEVWFLVDVSWLQEWKHFVTKNSPLPGPIDNSRLIDSRTGAPKPNLRPVADYRGVNSAIWAYWQERYGGGPSVKRRELNLYAEPVELAASEGNSEESASSRSGPRGTYDKDESRNANSTRRPQEVNQSGRHQQRSEEPPLSPQRGRTGDRQVPKGRLSMASNRTASAPPIRDNDLDEDVPTKPLCCDKCDGPHATDDCPHFAKPREKHADAWSSYGKKNKNGNDQEVVHIVRNARVIPQPADGSCLFHSLSYGLGDRSNAQTLRREICSYLEKHPDTVIADTSLKDWIHYDSGGTVQSYAQRMAGSTWGGGIEMAALTKMKTVNVHVYEKCDEGYRRISSFNNPKATKTISVLYKGRMHYEAIVV